MVFETQNVVQSLEEQSVTMSELKYPNEALEPSKEALGYGISVAPSSKSRGSLEINALREVVEKMRSDVSKSNKKIRSMTLEEERDWIKIRIEELKLQHETSQDDGPNASEESIQKIFSTLRSRCLEVDGVSCGLKITNCSTCNLSSPLYHVPQRCGAKQRLPLWIDSGKKDVICFSGTGDYCIFLVSFDIGTTLLRLTIFCRIDSYETCKLGMGFSSVNLPLDAALYSGLMGSSCLSQNWVMSEQSDTPVEIFSTQGNFFARGFVTPGPRSVASVEIWESVVHPVRDISSSSGGNLDYLQRNSSLIGSSDGVTCVMIVANGLNTAIKLRRCRSCERSTCAEVPPSGVDMIYATAKLSIEAAIAYEIEGTDLGFIVAVKAKENENNCSAVFLPVAEFMFDDSLEACLDQNRWNYPLFQGFHSAKNGDQTIETRNIRIKLNMTEGLNSQVQIRLYAV